MPTPILPGTVNKATPGAAGFDNNSVLSFLQAQSLKTSGMDFCLRYIPRTSAPSDINLTNVEAENILNAGLALMPVQHASPEGWTPTTSLGTQYGNYAAYYAREIVGLPKGINIWCDLEVVAANAMVAVVISYCQAWYYAVHTAGYVPGIYVGYGIKLTNEQLSNELSFQHYWKAFNTHLVPSRGYQIVQSEPTSIGHFSYDPDVTKDDHSGDAAFWLKI